MSIFISLGLLGILISKSKTETNFAFDIDSRIHWSSLVLGLIDRRANINLEEKHSDMFVADFPSNAVVGRGTSIQSDCCRKRR